ncbi:transport protein particle subunit trs85-2 [Physcia stellaris]|nr:transport protein particle subunit trs85-2 [Physcia stellaris]
MTSPFNPEQTSPREPRPTLSRQHSSGSLPNVDTTLSPKSPRIDGFLSASSPDVTQSPLRPLPQRLKSSEGPRKGSYERSSSVGTRSSSPAPLPGNYDEPRQIVTGSFAPRVSIYASVDTEEFIQGKGFTGGFRDLLRPYGERIPGKVVVRDSVGASKAWEDFGIMVVGPEDGQPFRPLSSEMGRSVNGRTSGPRDSTSSGGNSGSSFEKLIDHHLRNEETGEPRSSGYIDSDNRVQKPPQSSSKVYSLYLRKLLSSMLMVPYETFCHPVACIIAVSSHNQSPIETLRQLYNQSGRRIPTFVGPEYLRYYVLIHDEEQDDITKSTALFDLMKRHFGLHCHLLRLRSSNCVQSDDDSIEVPPSSWLPAEEDLSQISIIDYDTDSPSIHYIFDSDATAIRSFLREMVTQSLVPFMENRIMTWNDQVASRRRGLSGRFMSLSKRWTAFGSSRNSQNSSSPSSNSNYDPNLGIYPPTTPEATMRTLADYAFMLRDFRLAYSTYDFLRSDFSTDKAWAYHAAANEMAAISYLLIPQTASSRSRTETVDQMLETATYSYLTRCSLPFGAIRTLTLAIELLKSRGPTAAEEAARWGGKLLELGVLSPTSQAFMAERMGECYAAGMGLLAFGARRRQTAFWSLLAAQSWIRIDKPNQGRRQIAEARRLYSLSSTDGSTGSDRNQGKEENRRRSPSKACTPSSAL